MEYSAVIRTLGKAGEKYQKTLDSLAVQSIAPRDIFVFLAEGYEKPVETIGWEKVIYVKKGMVSQRALQYDEVSTPYILFLDDDVYLPPNAVETMFRELKENDGDVISPCVFANHKASLSTKFRLSLLGREFARPWGGRWAYKIMSNGGFSYLNKPIDGVYESQSNAGPCFLCEKKAFQGIEYIEEIWLEGAPYSFPDDQVMFYKMYRLGLKVLTSFDSGIEHLDASSTVTNADEKTRKIIYSEYRNKLIFWHRFLYLPSKTIFDKTWKILALTYSFGIQASKYCVFWIFGRRNQAESFFKGIRDARKYLMSDSYKSLRRIPAK